MTNIDLNVHVLHSVFGNRKKDIRQDMTNMQVGSDIKSTYALFYLYLHAYNIS